MPHFNKKGKNLNFVKFSFQNKFYKLKYLFYSFKFKIN